MNEKYEETKHLNTTEEYPDTLTKVLKHYDHNKIITMNKFYDESFPMLDINTPFLDNMSSSITVDLESSSKDIVFFIDNGLTAVNVGLDRNQFKKFLNKPKVQKGLKFCGLKYDAKYGILYLTFNFNKNYQNELRTYKGDKELATHDMWLDFEKALAGFIHGLLFIYTMDSLANN